MQIANRKIGPNEKPLVIAEIGINHGGDVEVAKHMVQLAAKSGCECVKHQTHFVEDEMTEAAKQIFPTKCGYVNLGCHGHLRIVERR